MRKILAVLALAVFLGGLSVPVMATSNTTDDISVTISDTKDKKAEKSEKTEKKSEAKSEKNCEAAKKGDCSKKCGEK